MISRRGFILNHLQLQVGVVNKMPLTTILVVLRVHIVVLSQLILFSRCLFMYLHEMLLSPLFHDDSIHFIHPLSDELEPLFLVALVLNMVELTIGRTHQAETFQKLKDLLIGFITAANTISLSRTFINLFVLVIISGSGQSQRINH